MSREDRLQIHNKRKAFERMANNTKFQNWLKLEAARQSGRESVEQRVDKMMDTANIKVEVRDETGKWVVQPLTV